jgi:two-component system NtrC family response regulator
VTLALPPLRERGEDLFLLARIFLEREAARAKKKLSSFAPEALRALEAYRWPGNVRELENRVRRAVVMADGPGVRPEDLELPDAEDAPSPGKGLREARETVEREAIRMALARHAGNVSHAAAELGISRPTLYGLMEKLGISRDA